MKTKNLTMMMILILLVSILTGCGDSKSSDDTSDENVIYGKVSKIESDTLTIQVGTMNQREKSSEQKNQKEEVSGENQPDLIDLTGEEQEIKITDDTTISQQKFGGGRGGQGTPPEPPTGEIESGETPNGEVPTGERPEMGSENGEKKGGEFQTETISLDDISEGDIVKITLDDDGNAAEITVMSMGRDSGQQPEQSETSTEQSNETVVY